MTAGRRRYAEVLRRLAGDEPRSTLAMGALLRARRPALEAKVIAVGAGGRTLCPVVRSEPGVWVAYPVLAHLDDAAVLGRAIDASVAVAVEGPAPEVDPLLASMRRVDLARRARRVTIPLGPGVDWEPPPPSTRLATVIDLPALVDLYDGYELAFGRTPRGLRRLLDDAVRRTAVVVSEGDGRLDGAIIAACRTPRFLEWSQLTVRPDARGQRTAWALVARAAAVNFATGLGFMAVIAPENPMTVPAGFGTVDDVSVVELRLPDRVPGERRLRRLWFDLDKTRPRRS